MAKPIKIPFEQSAKQKRNQAKYNNYLARKDKGLKDIREEKILNKMGAYRQERQLRAETHFGQQNDCTTFINKDWRK